MDLREKIFESIKRSHELFANDFGALPENPDYESCLSIRGRDQYGHIYDRVNSMGDKKTNSIGNSKTPLLGPSLPAPSQALVLSKQQDSSISPRTQNQRPSLGAIIPHKAPVMPKPQWHPPWKLKKVISGHTGWVRCLAVDTGNEWFASGSNDRTIKIWDLASGKLSLTVTGHISPVRGLAVSSNHPYLFSCGEDKQVKCWDLEQNKVIRHYHGHLSAVYSIAVLPELDILITGGRDKVARLWDMRTKVQIHSLSGHNDSIASVQCQPSDPQVITGSHDSTIRMWDIIAGKTIKTLTHHKKSVRALQFHPVYNMFASGAPDNIKQWMCPDGDFVQNLSNHKMVNCLAVNEDNVLVSGADDGSLYFWDWKSGYNFQSFNSLPQSGFVGANSIYAALFDRSGSRLITGECDATIKIHQVDEEATPESFPINWKPGIFRRTM